MGEDHLRLAEKILTDSLDELRNGDGFNGDIQERNLEVTLHMLGLVIELYQNPAVVLGRLLSKYPGVMVPIFVFGISVAVIVATMAIFSVMSTLGLTVHF